MNPQKKNDKDEIFSTIINTSANALDCFCEVDKFDVASKDTCKHEVHLFVLKNIKMQFDYEGLKRLIRNNLAEYVFSRKKVMKYKEDNEVSLGVLEAQLKLKNVDEEAINLKNFGEGGELGEILLFVFLEGFLKARKMLSKIEIKTNNCDYAKGFDAVHFYERKHDGYIAYQTIFGEAKIKKDLSEAVIDAFDSLVTSYSNKSTDLNLLEDSLLNEIVIDEVMAEVFKKQFIPKYQSASCKTEVEEAFAIFIGYTFEFPALNDKEQPSSLIQEKIKQDVESVKNYICKRIAKEKYTCDSDFYIYFLPLNDAIIDKKNIMQEIAGIQIKRK